MALGSIIAAIINTQRGTKNANEPRVVATPMSIPFICRTATTQHAAASPSVAVSPAAVVAVLVPAIAAEEEPTSSLPGARPNCRKRSGLKVPTRDACDSLSCIRCGRCICSSIKATGRAQMQRAPRFWRSSALATPLRQPSARQGVGPGDDGSGNPPAGFGNPYDNGAIMLVSADIAEY